MKLKLNISPCPNDTFMFEALLTGRIDTRGLGFEVGYHDIEQLNLRAMRREADITKISYAILPRIAGKYRVADSGSALGRGNGPVLVTKKGNTEKVKQGLVGGRLKLAVPGFHTTANLLVSRLFASVKEKEEVLFSRIADEVSAGNFDAGILIHEGRFTYRGKGLEAVFDLGTEWEKQTLLPLPLGGIAVANDIPRETAEIFEGLLKESILRALADPSLSRDYIKSHAQEMRQEVIESHIGLFVNDYSLSLGPTGRKAIRELTGTGPGIFL